MRSDGHQQNAITVAVEHGRLLQKLLAVGGITVLSHDRRSVPRRNIPANQIQTVGRGDVDVLVLQPEIGRRADDRVTLSHRVGDQVERS